jgi:hypothetical protein
MINWSEQIDERLTPFKRKYFKGLLIKGLLISGGLLLAYLFVAVMTESLFWMGVALRSFIFFVFLLITGYCYFRYLHKPIRWFIYKQGLKPDSTGASGRFRTFQSKHPAAFHGTPPHQI